MNLQDYYGCYFKRHTSFKIKKDSVSKFIIMLEHIKENFDITPYFLYSD